MIRAIGIGIGSWVGLNTISLVYTLNKAYNGTPIKPPKKVSIVLPSLTIDKEFIAKVMQSIMKNNVIIKYPEMFEYILVVDPEFQDFDDFNYFNKIIVAPFGKLTARDYGIRYADNDIIVAIDVDRYYPPNWLNELLKPFHDKSVVGTTGYAIYNFLYEPFANIPKDYYFSTKMDGGGSAFLKDAYFRIGGFNLNIDQFNWDAMVQEEEKSFKRKLEKVGEVVFVPVPNYSVIRRPAPERL